MLLKKLWNQLIFRHIMSVASALGPQVLPCPQLIFPSKTWSFGIYLNFQWAEITFKSMSPTF
jgi:hypothetical protein